MALYGKKPSPTALKGSIEAPQSKTIGLSWPPGNPPDRPYFTKSSSRELLVSQITQFVKTNKGERVMLPDFGTSLRQLLFSPLDSNVAAILADELSEGIAAYIPSIVVKGVRFFQGDNLNGFGLPGIRVELLISPKQSSNIINIKVKI